MNDDLPDLDAAGLLAAASRAVRARRLAEVRDLQVVAQWAALHSNKGSPPGQTGTHNSGPLGRRHHRWKTHAGYRARQCGQGRYVWLTPHGLGFLVDHRGTRPISAKHARMILGAPEGVDLYPGVHITLA